ncbi:ABC transporter ATP-binding protein [Acuticoccus sp.]|uniref:ABC transporter ATP-binding protein n=1 Tax=Acuticoccus sp. TaxID=1904378 RepID=UPI003B515588
MQTDAILTVEGLHKTYASGETALRDVSLTIRRGEILALLGPNGAGKTTLISIICGLTTPSAGRVTVDGHDAVADYKRARSLIGLVPQEVALEPFETVAATVRFSRGLFGKKQDPAHLEGLLRMLTLWDKRDAQLKELSGGMKRRVLIAKALAHGPRVLFLDEPTAGVDVELRKDMWAIVRRLREDGVTIILTTHYIEEAEAIAERVGIISNGQILLVEDKEALMRRMGRREVVVTLAEPLDRLPDGLSNHDVSLTEDRRTITYAISDAGPSVGDLFEALSKAGLTLTDVETAHRSLEDIFVELVENGTQQWEAAE